MEELLLLAVKHKEIFIGFVILWLCRAAITGMPLPDESRSDFRGKAWYQWAYSSCHGATGDIKTALNDPRLQAFLAKHKAGELPKE